MSLASWLRAALVAWGLVTLLLSPGFVLGQSEVRHFGSPGYHGRNACPERCSITGPNPSNWSAYHNLDQIQSCSHTIFYDFALYDRVDDADALHHIYACTSYGPDWANLPSSTTHTVAAQVVNATYEIGWWPDSTTKLPGSTIRSLLRQMRHYLQSGQEAANRTTLLFSQSGLASVGLYIGKGLQNEGTGSFALKTLHDTIPLIAISTGSLAMQLCQPGDDGDHVFGVIATSNASFSLVQDSLESWSNTECFSFTEGRKNVVGPAYLTTPFLVSINGTNPRSEGTNYTTGNRIRQLSPRSHCKTIQVASGDSCASLATKCGISGADFMKYNPAPNLCSTLQPLQHVCCSTGALPDFTPKPNPDGSCATYTVQNNDNCAGIAAANSLTVDQLSSFNKNTWAWNGCSLLWVGTVVCLSPGTPPMPAPVPNAVCGPQVPGTAKPPAGTDLSTLNPCPLNVCCDVWGQCGTTAEFCTNTSTGAPGTAKQGTNGCISNCGTSVVRSAAPAVFRNIAYFEGFSLSRPCLYQDAGQVDASKYTHIHFAFAALTSDYEVQFNDVLTKYEFLNFKRIQGAKKILSFGGWTFSTGPNTYTIFRQGVTPANRLLMATNIANFIINNNLDGVDIDWEYPGAPDIPGIPPADTNDGQNYLAFLVVLKNLLPGKSVSIAAPASYWYLKGFPIAQISKIVDYIIFMTYDLHGQWDASKQYSQPGCSSGMCLRSHVNLTETINALAMITKAGVPSNQVVVGVSSYGRSFAMAEAGCYTENCLFTGTALESNAAKGPCTDVAGYISDAEIKDIIQSGSVNQNYIDGTSNTNILVYNNTQWVGWMSPETKASRKAIYQRLNMGGTSDWASDLEDYNNVPPRAGSWSSFILKIKAGADPYQIGPRNGNWTSITCTDPSVEDIRDLTAGQRWAQMDGNDAWADVINVWTTYDKPAGRLTFLESVSDTIHGPEAAGCTTVLSMANCDHTVQCDGFVGAGSGAAGYQIWNSIVIIHEMYEDYYNALYRAAAAMIDPALKDFENKFAPVPKPPDDTWLQILLDFISLGATMIAAPFFNFHVAQLPYFVAKEGSADTLKDTVYAFIVAGTAVAKDLAGHADAGKPWSAEKQDEFSNYMGQVVSAWGNVTETTVNSIFNGDESSVNILTTLITDGKMIEGAHSTEVPSAGASSDTALQQSVAKAFFAYAIPAIWEVSGLFPFIIDSGYACGTIDPLGQYLSPDSMHAAHACQDGKLYYLATPAGKAETCNAGSCDGCDTVCTGNYFSTPPGLEWLDGTSFGGITADELIRGAVRTYIQNGNQNGGGVADPASAATLDDLYNQDVTTPGYVRMPVCSPDIAFTAWDKVGGPDTSAPFYPCVVPQGRNDCGDSTFVDRTSDASPAVADCLQIVKNIQGTDGEWEVETVFGEQHQLVQFGSCKFGIQAKGTPGGNIHFHVGGQDIVDIINESVKRFGGSGKVGAKGDMSCKGNIKAQNVEWGLY